MIMLTEAFVKYSVTQYATLWTQFGKLAKTARFTFVIFSRFCSFLYNKHVCVHLYSSSSFEEFPAPGATSRFILHAAALEVPW